MENEPVIYGVGFVDAKPLPLLAKLSRVWKQQAANLNTQVSTYQACVLSTLLNGCESWVMYPQAGAEIDQLPPSLTLLIFLRRLEPTDH